MAYIFFDCWEAAIARFIHSIAYAARKALYANSYQIVDVACRQIYAYGTPIKRAPRLFRTPIAALSSRSFPLGQQYYYKAIPPRQCHYAGAYRRVGAYSSASPFMKKAFSISAHWPADDTKMVTLSPAIANFTIHNKAAYCPTATMSARWFRR